MFLKIEPIAPSNRLKALPPALPHRTSTLLPISLYGHRLVIGRSPPWQVGVSLTESSSVAGTRRGWTRISAIVLVCVGVG